MAARAPPHVIFPVPHLFYVPTYEEVQAILRSLGLKRSEILIYWALHKKGAPMGVKEIVEATGLSEKTVRTALKLMVAHGYVRVEGKRRGARYVAVPLGEVVERLKKRIEERISELLHRFTRP